MNETKVPENKAYKVTLVLLLGLAVFSTAMRDLNRIRQMISSAHEFTSQWRGTDTVVPNEDPALTPVLTNESCPNDIQLAQSSAESGSSDSLAYAGDVEMERIDYEAIIKPEVGGRVELLASKKANRRVANLVRSKYDPARHLKEELSAKRPNGHWPARFEYRTLDRSITLDFPMTMITDIKAELANESSPDFPLTWVGKLNRKQSHGKAETGKRELMIKRFERITNSRRAS